MKIHLNRAIVRTSLAATVLVTFAPVVSQGHDENIHKEISRSAFRSSDGLKAFLTDSLGSDYAPFTNRPILVFSPGSSDRPVTAGSPMQWLADGSYYEDMQDPLFLGNHFLRSSDHFYTLTPQRQPGHVTGLTDASESPVLKMLPSPITNSFVWATTPGMVGPSLFGVSAGMNMNAWQNARQAQYSALTFTNKSDREAMLALMLYDLGHVLHLNQDLTSPDHVRNDEHVKNRWFEDYGSKTYLKTAQASAAARAQLFPLSDLGKYERWQTHGFQRLLDFWDRGLYTGNAQALNNDATNSESGQQLGAAEFSNGNFLGEDALYKEYFSPGDIHYFPFPSLNSGTTFPSVRSHLAAGAMTEFLRNGKPITRIGISKTNDGISVTHHSVLNYLGAKFPKKGGPVAKVSSTINDTNVLQEHHSILIPKAIDYSTMILEYFFRGILFGRVSWDEEAGMYTLEIWNPTAQDFKGGSFTLYRDDASGNRTLVSGVSSDYSGSLAASYAESFHLSFPPPTEDTARYVLVYKGTIGTTGGAAIDTVDENLAIAVMPFSILRFQVFADDFYAYTLFVDLENVFYEYQYPNGSGGSYIYAGGWLDESTRINGDTVFYVNYYDSYDDPNEPVDFTLYTFFNKAAPITINSFTLQWANQGADFPEGVEGPAVLDSWYVRKRIKAQDNYLIQY